MTCKPPSSLSNSTSASVLLPFCVTSAGYLMHNGNYSILRVDIKPHYKKIYRTTPLTMNQKDNFEATRLSNKNDVVVYKARWIKKTFSDLRKNRYFNYYVLLTSSTKTTAYQRYSLFTFLIPLRWRFPLEIVEGTWRLSNSN